MLSSSSRAIAVCAYRYVCSTWIMPGVTGNWCGALGASCASTVALKNQLLQSLTFVSRARLRCMTVASNISCTGKGGDCITIGSTSIDVLFTPCHTKGHIMFYGQCCCCRCLLPRLLRLPSNHSSHLFLQYPWLEPLVLDHQHYLQDVLERCLPVMQVRVALCCRWKRTLLYSLMLPHLYSVCCWMWQVL